MNQDVTNQHITEEVKTASFMSVLRTTRAFYVTLNVFEKDLQTVTAQTH